MKKIKAVFFDIDGTLVSFATHRVPQSAVDALAALRANGVKTFIATGRMPAMLGVVSELPFDGYVTYNGAHCATADWTQVYANPLDRSDLLSLAARLEHDRFPVAFMQRHEMTANRVNDRVREAHALIDTPVPRIEDPRRTIEEDVFQLCVYVDPEKDREIIPQVMPNSETNRWTHLFADINRRGNRKSTGIDRMIAHFGIGIDETMAFGDGGNDIAMLRHAGIGVAMGNAGDGVKASARHVTDTVDNDGIRKALEHFRLI